jgi:hypothetical protein
MKNRNLFGLMALAFVLSLATVSACSCMAPGTPLEELNRSDAVFAGKVIDIDKGFMDYTYKVTFEVQDSWKGIEAQEITLQTGQDSAMCGYPFEVNKTYLVYADQLEGELTAGLCSRTALLSNEDFTSNEDLEELGAPQHSYCAGRCGVQKLSFFDMIREWFAKIFSK